MKNCRIKTGGLLQNVGKLATITNVVSRFPLFPAIFDMLIYRKIYILEMRVIYFLSRIEKFISGKSGKSGNGIKKASIYAGFSDSRFLETHGKLTVKRKDG